MDGACGPQFCDNYIEIVDIIFKFCADKMLKLE